MNEDEIIKILQQMADIRLDCAECKAQVAPKHISFDDHAVSIFYEAECLCGAHLCGIIAPQAMVEAFHSRVAARFERQGLSPPKGIRRPLPDGWPSAV